MNEQNQQTQTTRVEHENTVMSKRKSFIENIVVVIVTFVAFVNVLFFLPAIGFKYSDLGNFSTIFGILALIATGLMGFDLPKLKLWAIVLLTITVFLAMYNFVEMDVQIFSAFGIIILAFASFEYWKAWKKFQITK